MVEVLIREITEIGTQREAYILGQILLDEGIIYHPDFQPKFEEGVRYCFTNFQSSDVKTIAEILPSPSKSSLVLTNSPSTPTTKSRKKNRFNLSILIPKKSTNNRGASVINHKFFGQPYATILEQDGVKAVPKLIESCITILSRQESLEQEGLFRISSAADYVELCKLLDAGQPVDLEKYSYDPHIIANVFKKWLRELPEPLLTFALYPKFSTLTEGSDEELIPKAKAVISQLPTANLQLATAVFNFLHIVASYSTLNKMHFRNLGTVFSPLLLRSPEIDPTLLALYSTSLTEIVKFLIEHAHSLF